MMMQASPNATCPCGSGRKYKQCSLSKDEAQRKPQTGVDVGAAIAAGTVAAVVGGVSLGKVRGEMYHAGSVLGDVEFMQSFDQPKPSGGMS